MNTSAMRCIAILWFGLALGACAPSSPPPAGVDTAEVDAAAPEVPPTTAARAGNGAVIVSRTSAGSAPVEATLPIDDCDIVNGGANGVVRAADGSFELSWADGNFRLVWASEAGVYSGRVSGAVDGNSVDFNGTSGALTVSGSATCR